MLNIKNGLAAFAVAAVAIAGAMTGPQVAYATEVNPWETVEQLIENVDPGNCQGAPCCAKNPHGCAKDANPCESDPAACEPPTVIEL